MGRRWWLVAAVPLFQLPFLVNWLVGLNADHAIPYLMARHVLRGEHPVFFWGNRYMGALEAYAGAALIRVLHADAAWVVNLVPLLAYVGAAAIVVSRTDRDRLRPLALLLVATPPAMFLPIDRPGFSHGAILWLGWAAFVALGPGLSAEPLDWRACARSLAAGLVLAGTCFYIQTGMFAVLALLPLLGVAIALDWRRRAPRFYARSLARIGQAALASAAGLAGLWPGEAPNTEMAAPDLGRLRLLGNALLQFSPWVRLGTAVPGLTTFYAGLPGLNPTPHAARHDSATPLAIGFTVLLGLTCAFGLARLFAAAARSVKRGEGAAEPFPFERAQWALLGGGLVAAFLLSREVWDLGHARYLAPLWIPIAVLAAEGLRGVDRRLGIALAAAWLVAAGAGTWRTLGVDDALNHDLGEAFRYAEAHGAEAGVANYWLSYLADARWQERLIVRPQGFDRYPRYGEAVDHAKLVALFAFTDREPVQTPPGVHNFKAHQVFGDMEVGIYAR